MRGLMLGRCPQVRAYQLYFQPPTYQVRRTSIQTAEYGGEKRRSTSTALCMVQLESHLKIVSWYTRLDDKSSCTLFFPSDRGGGNTGGPTALQTRSVSFCTALALALALVARSDDRFPFFVIFTM